MEVIQLAWLSDIQKSQEVLSRGVIPPDLYLKECILGNCHGAKRMKAGQR
jgi:hypothetical protein